MTERALLSRDFDASVVGADPVEVEVVTTSDERSAIAADLGLLDLPALKAVFSINRDAKGDVRIIGELEASVIQSCVVSLKPVVQNISEAFERRYAVAGGVGGPPTLDTDPAAEDPPERLIDRRLDLGAVVLEQLALAIDPYPRALDADLPGRASAGNDKAESPFAALKSLGHRQEG